jgi:hypothetical protein
MLLPHPVDFSAAALIIVDKLIRMDITRLPLKGDIVSDIKGKMYLVMAVPHTNYDDDCFAKIPPSTPGNTPQGIPASKLVTVISVTLKKSKVSGYDIATAGTVQLFVDVDDIRLAIYV